MRRTSTTGNWTRQRGFTLIELALVLLLISLFALLTLPVFSGTSRHNVQRSARKVSGTIKYLFNEAVLTGREHQVLYDLDHSFFLAHRLDGDGNLLEMGRWSTETYLADQVRFSALQLPGRGRFTAGQVTVRIHPSGWMEETIIELSDAKEYTLTLHVNPLTGSTEIFKGKRQQ